ncbi:MAG: low molecular weight phosphotyrosine protein phosphatase [Porticoccaceae bacterium]|nr:low molecular weight phosphotyrosine protein phosphatase [Porticoccaceae bacterium]MDG1475059.1 low molecular weight phosphotyrosine protein phosphatase [Porticoccaceae bacterium]
MAKVSVLFVCLGNICRSPTAHAVFQSLVDQRGLTNIIDVDSAGTGDWHLGHAPDRRSTEVAAMAGYDMSALRSRLVNSDDFYRFNYVVAMDAKNLSDLKKMAPTDFTGNLSLLLAFSTQSKFSSIHEVPDPYYGGGDGFPLVLDMVVDSCTGLLDYIVTQINRPNNV